MSISIKEFQKLLHMSIFTLVKKNIKFYHQFKILSNGIKLRQVNWVPVFKTRLEHRDPSIKETKLELSESILLKDAK